MKKIVIPNSINQIKNTLNYSDAYLIGIKDMCVNVNYEVELEQLNEIIKIIEDKELFIALNKNMTNNDIELLKKILVELNNYSIKGVFYADVAILSLSQNLNLNFELVWANEHSTTNYRTINYWYSFGANYTYISTDITLNEIINIKNNTKSKLIVPIFGYLPMFVSKRHIVKNYLDYFSLESRDKINFISKENKIYPIVDNDLGTLVYSNNILDGFDCMDELEKNGIEYITLNSFNISDDDFVEVLKIYNNQSDKKISNIFENIDTGFLYKETIYKVKK